MFIFKNKFLKLLLPAVLFIILSTILIRIYDLDLICLDFFYNYDVKKIDKSWELGRIPPWKWLYEYGNLPAIIIGSSALILYLLSFVKKLNFINRRVNLFIALVLIIGPGIVVNLVLKENWGRPRPREIIRYGGHKTFEKVLTIDKSSDGKSFCCGHCSVAYYFFFAFFLFYKRNKLYSYISLILSIIFGISMSIARMAAGGHFLSDVIWSGFIIYATSCVLYFLLRLNQQK